MTTKRRRCLTRVRRRRHSHSRRQCHSPSRWYQSSRHLLAAPRLRSNCNVMSPHRPQPAPVSYLASLPVSHCVCWSSALYTKFMKVIHVLWRLAKSCRFNQFSTKIVKLSYPKRRSFYCKFNLWCFNFECRLLWLLHCTLTPARPSRSPMLNRCYNSRVYF